MKPAAIIRLCACAGVGLALSACGHSAPTLFLTLDPVAPSSPSPSAAAYAGPPVRIDSVRIPAALDRPELVREFAANQLQVDDFAHWGAPLGSLMRTALTQDLLARLPAGRVVFPDAAASRTALGVDVDVLAVNAAAGQLAIDVSWSLAGPPAPKAAGSAAPIAHDLRLSTPVSGSGAAEHAAALSALLAQLSDAIVLQLASAT